MMSYKSRNELWAISEEMVEQMGAVAFLNEVMQSMSTDELRDTVKHVDRHCFGNHYLK